MYPTSLEDDASCGKFIDYLEITSRNTEILTRHHIFAFLTSFLFVQKETLFYRTWEWANKQTDKNPDIFRTSIFSSAFEGVELEP